MRNFIEIECEQGSDEWFQERCAIITGTMAKNVLMKKSEGVGRFKSLVKLWAEEKTGKAIRDDFEGNKNTERGKDEEPFTRMRYEARTGLVVRSCGLLKHKKVQAGCSLDGYSNNYRIIQEFKNVLPHVLVGWILKGDIPNEHLPQCRHNTWLTGAEELHFYATSEDAPPGWDELLIIKKAEELQPKEYEKELYKFILDFNELKEKLEPLRIAA